MEQVAGVVDWWRLACDGVCTKGRLCNVHLVRSLATVDKCQRYKIQRNEAACQPCLRRTFWPKLLKPGSVGVAAQHHKVARWSAR